MKILIIASEALSLINFRKHLIQAFQSNNYQVHVAVPVNSNEVVAAQLQSMGLTVHPIFMQRTGLNPLADIKTLKSLICLMKHIKPKIVLSYTIKPVIYGSIAAKFSKVKNVVALITGLGSVFIDSQSSYKKRLLRRCTELLYKMALKNIKHVFFQNPDDKELFHSKIILNIKHSSSVVNGSGVDLEYYQDSLLPEKLSFIFIGRFLKDKGIREYLEAAKIIKRKAPLVKFYLVGYVDLNPSSISNDELKHFTDSGYIDYLGELKDVRHAIKKASVFVLPSYREGTPRSVLESMSMGRPIITTDAPGCRETVIDGDNGFLVPIKSVDKLVDAMGEFINNPLLIEKMGLRSREIAEDKYDVHKVNKIMLEQMGI